MRNPSWRQRRQRSLAESASGARRGGGSVARSASVICGWRRGSSRKNQLHSATQARLMTPTTTKEPRHETSAIRLTMMSGVAALPRRAKQWVMPRITPVAFRDPARHGARRGRKRRSLADAEQEAHAAQREGAGHRAGQHGGGAHDEPTEAQHATRAEAVAEPAADELEDGVGQREGAEGDAELLLRQMEVLAHQRAG